jgi:hypothetical protein
MQNADYRLQSAECPSIVIRQSYFVIPLILS